MIVIPGISGCERMPAITASLPLTAPVIGLDATTSSASKPEMSSNFRSAESAMNCFATSIRSATGCSSFALGALHEIHDHVREFLAAVFLDEVSTTGDGCVKLPLRSRDTRLERLVSVPRYGIAVAERGQEGLLPAF